jgi:hypothetical protein
VQPINHRQRTYFSKEKKLQQNIAYRIFLNEEKKAVEFKQQY